MAELKQLIELARRLSPSDRAELARALSEPVRQTLPLLSAPPAPPPHSAAWLEAERGHAVLDASRAPESAEVPAGPDAIAGMWSERP